MDFTKLEMPRKDVKTPMKDGKMMNGSRPCSPEREIQVGVVYITLSPYRLSLNFNK